MNTTRIVLITVIVLCGAAAINFVRDGGIWPIARVLPFASGQAPGIYDIGAIVVGVIGIIGLKRVFSDREDDA